jgi:uncharacterized membrane protein
MSTPVTGTVQSPSASSSAETIVIREISIADLKDALRLGWEDFKAVPTHAVMLVVIYPVLGLLLARVTLGYSVLPLLFPLAAGFALLGPFAALGCYELSRRREDGENASASHALGVLSSPSVGAMLGLGGALLILFLVWLTAAQSIYSSIFGYAPASSIPNFLNEVLTTPKGLSLIIIGCGVGFLFALVALCISVLDRHSSAADAVLTSLRVVAQNPIQMAIWGLIVAVLLVIGTLPFFLGLTVVIPVLGHATWHLYRKVVEPPAAPYVPPEKHKVHLYAAEFPVSLFMWGRKHH